MKRVLILVEGQTEEGFVNNILNPLLRPESLILHPTLVRTKLVKSGPNFKGGLSTYSQVKRDLVPLFRDSNAAGITTMFDLYGLPSDFPRWRNTGTAYEKVCSAEKAFGLDIGESRFIPYLQLHEFEGLLFSSPEAISTIMRDPRKLTELEAVRASVASPEEINNGPTTHPSMRIKNMFPGYEKVLFGSLIARRIGLDLLRHECPHFASWIDRLLAI